MHPISLAMALITSAWTDQYLIFFPPCKHVTLTLSLFLLDNFVAM